MGISTIVLETKNITKKFKEGSKNEFSVIEDSSFSIQSGEIVSFIGKSGCGKTTLLQMCGLIDTPTSGSVWINGVNTTVLSEKERTNIRKNNIGFVYQAYNVFPEFTTLENVAIPLLISGYSKKEAFKKAEELLELLYLKNKINNMPAELSGGEKQRVAIARAVVNHPKLILADEPTGNLDEVNSKNVMNLFFDIVRRYNLALLMVSHNIELAKNCDKIITIKDKKIVDFS